MRFVIGAVLLTTLPALALGCSHEYEVRDATHSREAQSEARWLREEVRSLRASLAERDRREAEMWRAYVDLAQRIGTLQPTRESAKPTEATATLMPPNEPTPPACITSATASDGSMPRKSVSRAINQSRLSVKEKRQLLQSMRPPRVIDIVNPWDADK